MEREALARALRRRDQRVYEELMEDYGRLLWTIVSGILSGVGTREDVEEVISDVFWELGRQPEQFDPKRGEIQTLLRVKAQSRAIDRLRKLCRAPTVPLEEAEEASGGDLWECISQRDTVRAVCRLLRNTKQPDREILTLRILYGVKPADIAAKLHLPVQQVYERLRRGKNRLAESLRQEGIV